MRYQDTRAHRVYSRSFRLFSPDLTASPGTPYLVPVALCSHLTDVMSS
jgi:hypothetical protein